MGCPGESGGTGTEVRFLPEDLCVSERDRERDIQKGPQKNSSLVA